MDQARDELIIAWGLWVGGAEPDRDRVVGSAVDALVAGLDSPGLCELAGLPPYAPRDEIDRLIRQAAAELGLPRPSENLALQTEALHLARRVLSGDVDARTLTSWAFRRLGWGGAAELQVLVRLDEEYNLLWQEDVPGYWEAPSDRPEQLRALEDIVRSVAAAVVAGETDLARHVPAGWGHLWSLTDGPPAPMD